MLKVEEVKKTGAIYTPIQLGEYMARKMYGEYQGKLDFNKVYTVLDPSCGTGDLLYAAVRVANSLGIKIKVYGFDLNSTALQLAKEKMDLCRVDSVFYESDFLKFAIENSEKKDSIFDEPKQTFDFILANPPYIRTQILGDEYSKKLSKTFGLKGKIDIYQAFYASFPSVMHSESIMSVITSNKFLTNKTGKDLRTMLHSKFRIFEIIDLGDTKVFDAAVLPAIIVGKLEDKKQEATTFYSLYESKLACIAKDLKLSIFDVIDSEIVGTFNNRNQTYVGKKGLIIFPNDNSQPWSLSTKEDFDWTKKVDLKFPNRVKDFGKVRVGIKTTADNVFINQGFDGYVIEDRLLHPLFNSKASSKWKLSKSIEELPSILYPMIPGKGSRKAMPINLDEYPKAKSYLKSYFGQLDGRNYIKKAKRKWYEIWVPQDPKLWKEPKIVWPDISDKPKFLYDNSGLYVDGNCYWFVMNEMNNDILFLILGVCNSSLMKKYHEIKFQNKLYSSKYRYVTQYVEQYPIPNIDCKEAKEIINLVKKLIVSGEDVVKEQRIDELLTNIINK